MEAFWLRKASREVWVLRARLRNLRRSVRVGVRRSQSEECRPTVPLLDHHVFVTFLPGLFLATLNALLKVHCNEKIRLPVLSLPSTKLTRSYVTRLYSTNPWINSGLIPKTTKTTTISPSLVHLVGITHFAIGHLNQSRTPTLFLIPTVHRTCIPRLVSRQNCSCVLNHPCQRILKARIFNRVKCLIQGMRYL